MISQANHREQLSGSNSKKRRKPIKSIVKEIKNLQLERFWVKKFFRITQEIISSGLQIETP